MKIAPNLLAAFAPGSVGAAFDGASTSLMNLPDVDPNPALEHVSFASLVSLASSVQGPVGSVSVSRAIQSNALKFDQLGMFGLYGQVAAATSPPEAVAPNAQSVPSSSGQPGEAGVSSTLGRPMTPGASQGPNFLAGVTTAMTDDLAESGLDATAPEGSPAENGNQITSALASGQTPPDGVEAPEPEAEPMQAPAFVARDEPSTNSAVNLLVSEYGGGLHLAAVSPQTDADAQLRWREAAEQTAASFGKRILYISLNGKSIGPVPLG